MTTLVVNSSMLSSKSRMVCSQPLNRRSCIPQLSMTITTEVVDDETQHVVTAGSIVTVTISLTRKGLDMHLGSLGFGDSDDGEAEEKDADEIEDNIDDEEDENLDKEMEEKEEEKKKGRFGRSLNRRRKQRSLGSSLGSRSRRQRVRLRLLRLPMLNPRRRRVEVSLTERSLAPRSPPVRRRETRTGEPPASRTTRTRSRSGPGSRKE